MKRLFYVTKTLDDAEAISDEVHELGIDDHHFYVLSRDETGIKTHRLHGSRSLNKTQLLSGKKRALLFATGATIVAAIVQTLIKDITNIQNFLISLLICTIVFFVVRGIAYLAGRSFDDYFQGVFDDHLDSGEAIVVIDVSKEQAKQIEVQLAKHPLASFLVDSSNIESPIPD